MSKILVEFADGLRESSRDVQDAALEEEINRFSEFMSNLQSPLEKGHLENFERAALKSYLIYKLTAKDRSVGNGS